MWLFNPFLLDSLFAQPLVTVLDIGSRPHSTVALEIRTRTKSSSRIVACCFKLVLVVHSLENKSWFARPWWPPPVWKHQRKITSRALDQALLEKDLRDCTLVAQKACLSHVQWLTTNWSSGIECTIGSFRIPLDAFSRPQMRKKKKKRPCLTRLPRF